MLRRLLHKLRMIRYYSAPRPRTAWSRAADIALLASFALALPATWLCDLVVVRSDLAIGLSGQLFRRSDGSIIAALTMPHSSRPFVGDGMPIGNLQLQVVDRSQGWPLITTLRRLPAQLDVDLRDELKPRTDAQLAADDPLRLGVQAALRADQQREALAAWVLPGAEVNGQPQRRWISFLLGATLWWMMLAFGSSLALGLARFGCAILRGKQAARRAQLRAEGKCLSCGYNLTGLEFNERCPECGELVW